MTPTKPQSPEHLKDCPFCGSKPDMIFKGNDRTAKRAVTIKCPTCLCCRTDAGITSPLTTLARVALEQWNTRHTQPPSVQPDDKSVDKDFRTALEKIMCESCSEKDAIIKNLRRELEQLRPYKDIMNQAINQLKVHCDKDALKYFKCKLSGGIFILQIV